MVLDQGFPIWQKSSILGSLCGGGWMPGGCHLDKEFHQIGWDAWLEEDVTRIVRLAVAEDCGPFGDATTASLVPEEEIGATEVAMRQDGVIAGLRCVAVVLRQIDPGLTWNATADDGQCLVQGAVVGRIEGPVRGMLTAERTVLNLLGRLSGIATLTRRYVAAVAGTKARIYDTRKTTPGWRRMEKYAVRLGGGCNHRTGLYDALLIKDNHLAFGGDSGRQLPAGYSPSEAVVRARRWLAERVPVIVRSRMILEVEVDTLAQLREVLPENPDIVLLDNMTTQQLRQAVTLRDASASTTELEASGGVRLDTVAAIAATGVERISVGALTHSATSLDVGLDWLPAGTVE
jgi:nicotinate-nucleotide pyrophosphorylase (carboxylating)